MKLLCILGMLALISVAGVNGAGECGKSSPEEEAMNLAPCAIAVEDYKAPVSDSCCAQVKRIDQNPACLCAVMLSNIVRSSGIKPEIAMSIPKRCGLANRPVGYQCGPYTLP
ncbi:hypothetical protein Nepgr_012028 [Nepenthes gracilis]|uniref:Bifunctional inhibitor/plant lipid transfer protein/seed storage helical domain-containing protein n=1 Tax=Nepenthes gracilis TaxID=150966 RepID=A0AAD3SGL1_NEPGR|nr:hypothetical protein Nepgr_012028 [Nepenthes gracilis]